MFFCRNKFLLPDFGTGITNHHNNSFSCRNLKRPELYNLWKKIITLTGKKFIYWYNNNVIFFYKKRVRHIVLEFLSPFSKLTADSTPRNGRFYGAKRELFEIFFCFFFPRIKLTGVCGWFFERTKAWVWPCFYFLAKCPQSPFLWVVFLRIKILFKK